MRDKGFTVIELVTVGAVLAAILVLALPEFVRASTREREEEVKSKIHTIQVALERYAVDSGGVYPMFLVGAERESNILRCYVDYMRGERTGMLPVHGTTPFAGSGGREILGFCGSPCPQFTADPLIYYNYLYAYPVNPFARPDSGLWNSFVTPTGGYGVYPYGGLHGDKMFDLGFGYGDTPQTDFILYATEAIEENEARGSDGSVVSDPDLDAPGNFYYHPVFSDLIPVYFHYADAYSRRYFLTGLGPDAQSDCAMSNEVVGYYLYGYGGPGHRDSVDEGGLDYFSRMPDERCLSQETIDLYGHTYGGVLDSTVGAYMMQRRVETTGYPACEFDPWTGAWPYGINPSTPDEVDDRRMSGPDGVNDWVIIEVTSGIEIHAE